MIQNCIAVLVAQIIFLWLRTLNVRHVADGHVWMAILTGTGVGISWLITVSLGVDALFDFANKWPVAACHTFGGALGTYMGMYKRKQKSL
jgi:4-amino-4-deoxy-L-arabinose transferase-like glycosyltransferase